MLPNLSSYEVLVKDSVEMIKCVCGRDFKITSIFKHFSHKNVDCKQQLTSSQIGDIEFKHKLHHKSQAGIHILCR